MNPIFAGQGRPIFPSALEIWFQDEARVGQKNKITRRRAQRGTRPSAPKDQWTKSAYIFGAICQEQGKGAGLVLPFCNIETISLQLTEISLMGTVKANAPVVDGYSPGRTCRWGQPPLNRESTTYWPLWRARKSNGFCGVPRYKAESEWRLRLDSQTFLAFSEQGPGIPDVLVRY